METIASLINGYVTAHPHLAYGVVFGLALAETVPVVGAVVPGSALLIGISALAPQGAVSVWPLLVAAVLGAVAGDGISYWLGCRSRAAILRRWPINRYPGLVTRSARFFHRHGPKSIFLGRFTPGVRAFIPLIAGILRMPAARFYSVNVLSAVAWAPANVLPGLAVGASISRAGPLAGRLGALIVIIIVGLWLVLDAVRYALGKGVPFVLVARDRVWRWTQGRKTWVSQAVRAVLDPARKEAGTLAVLAALMLVAAWLFFEVLEDVVEGDPLVQIDRGIYNFFQGLRTPWADAVMVAITELGDRRVVAAILGTVFLWLASRRAWRATLYWVAAVGFAGILNTSIKLLIGRPRPVEELTGWSAFSFPSGHSTVNAVMYGFLGFLLAREARPAWRVPILAAALSVPALIALSRLYLGVHWFSDVVGSLLFATAWVIPLAIAYGQHRPPPIEVWKLSAVVCAAVVLVGGSHVYRRHPTDLQRYAVRYKAPSSAFADWVAGGWKALPTYRTALTGETEEPLTVQWVGPLRGLEARLLSHGWRRPGPWTLRGALTWLAGVADPLTLPVFPHAQVGRMPSLTLIRSPAAGMPTDTRLVLRLWTADREVRNSRARPLWVGSVVEERLSHPLTLFTVTRTQDTADGPRDALAAVIGKGWLCARDSPSKGWDGWVLLAWEGETRDGEGTASQFLPSGAGPLGSPVSVDNLPEGCSRI